jgi:outer membrane lipoprotein LolB
MWPTAEIMRRLLTACCGALLLAGCATPRVSHEPLAAPEQEALLRNLTGFQFEGRVGVRAAGESPPAATLSWRQRGAESQLRLGGPLGAGSQMLVYSQASLRVTTSQGEVFEGAEAVQNLSSQLGFMPPFEALRHWVLGLAAPGEPPAAQMTDATGRIIEMTQLDWHIRYDRWTRMATRAGEVRLPQRLIATRADLRLTVVVDRWKLPAVD